MSGDLVVDAAARLQVPVRSLRAVLRVECGSDDPARWVAGDGRAIIRLEAHHVLRRVVGQQVPQVLRVRDPHGGHWYGPGVAPPRPWEGHEVLIDGAWSDYHRQERQDGRPCEWDALDAAGLIVGPDAAIECASWGPGQVLGSHWRTLGYDAPRGVAAAAATPAGGLELVARYLELVAPAALVALRAGDFVKFAAVYNGPGKAAEYGALLAAAAARVGSGS